MQSMLKTIVLAISFATTPATCLTVNEMLLEWSSMYLSNATPETYTASLYNLKMEINGWTPRMIHHAVSLRETTRPLTDNEKTDYLEAHPGLTEEEVTSLETPWTVGDFYTLINNAKELYNQTALSWERPLFDAS